MTSERFLRFSQTVDDLQKSVRTIKFRYAARYGVKGNHLFWLCTLLKYPEGLTASTLAKRINIDRSLISREIEPLFENGFIEYTESNTSRNYNTPIRLTETGALIAKEVSREGLNVQLLADEGIDEQDLLTFYAVAEKLSAKLYEIADRVTTTD